MNTSLSRPNVWLAAAATILVAAVSWADGQPDATFGTNGVVKIAFPASSLGFLYGTALINGQIEAAGFEAPNGIPSSATPPPRLFIAQLSLAGVVASMQSYSQTAINGPQALVIAPNGDVIVTGTTVGSNGLLNATAVRFSSAGAVLATFTRTATSNADQSILLGKIILDNQGRLVASGAYGSLTGTLQLAAVRLSTASSQLTADATFGTNGFAIVATAPAGYTSVAGTRVVQDLSSGAYYVGGVTCSGAGCAPTYSPVSAQIVARLSATNGSLDTNYGSAGFGIAFTTNNLKGNPEGMAVDAAGRVVIGGNTQAQGAMNGTSYVARLTSLGVPDATFGTNGVVQSYETGAGAGETVDVLTDSGSRVYALSRGSSLYRLTNTGAVDATFQSTGSNISTVNGNSSAWQSVQFTDSTDMSV